MRSVYALLELVASFRGAASIASVLRKKFEEQSCINHCDQRLGKASGRDKQRS